MRGKPKYLKRKKGCPSCTLPTTNRTRNYRHQTRVSAVTWRRLTA